MRNFEIFAHHGGNLGPPNTIANFQLAYDTGIDGIETDICLSRDGEPILYHPGTHYPEINQFTWPEIQQQFSWVANLDQLCDFLQKSTEFKCLLEIKEPPPKNFNLVERIVTRMKDNKSLYDQIYLTSTDRRIPFLGFYNDSRILIQAKRVEPRVKTHVIATIPWDLAKTVKEAGADMISYGWVNDSWLSQATFALFAKRMANKVAEAQALGAKVIAGIPNNDDRIMELLHYSVSVHGRLDGIVTDNPKLAYNMLIEILHYLSDENPNF